MTPSQIIEYVFLLIAVWIPLTVTAGYIYRQIWVRGSKNTKFVARFDEMMRNTPLYQEIQRINENMTKVENQIHSEIDGLKQSLPPSIDIDKLESNIITQINNVRESIPPSPNLDAFEKKILEDLVTLREGVQDDILNFELSDGNISKISKAIHHSFQSEKGGVMKGMSMEYKAEARDLAELEVTQYPDLLWALQNIEGLVDAGYVKQPAAEKLIKLAGNSMWQPRLENIAKGIREAMENGGNGSNQGSGLQSWR